VLAAGAVVSLSAMPVVMQYPMPVDVIMPGPKVTLLPAPAVLGEPPGIISRLIGVPDPQVTEAES